MSLNLNEIEQGAQLKHVEVAHDASAPIIEPDVHIGQNVHGQLFAEVQQGASLKHVDVEHDASAPIIEPDVHIGENPMKQVLGEIAKNQDWVSSKEIN